MDYTQQAKLQSLKGSITEALQTGEAPSNLADLLMDRSRTHVKQKDETDYWDYKEELDLSDPRATAKLAKWVLGFHNANGGALIIGVNNEYTVCGVQRNCIHDTVSIKNKIRKYTGDIPLFQGRLPTSRVDRDIWIIFVHKRQGAPVACQDNGPVEGGRPVVQKEKYYVRNGDETITCVSPNDYERLFHGFSFKHLNAYSYEVDDPYFRLLAPHHLEFVERNDLMEELQNAFNTRSYIIALDGVGGAGKSALAIELVRRFYRARTFDFIVSLSAKNKIWTTHSASTQANFSGFTELLNELAKVLQIQTTGKSPQELKLELIAFMEGIRGLLLIDNLEEITDPNVFQFLKDEVPEPIKILVTSRISRNLSARTISVPQMTQDEAITLLRKELDRVGRSDLTFDDQAVGEILKAAGRLPLAIKWAASLAGQSTSLRQVSTDLRKHDATKQEFLDFCFSTMFSDLSELAKKVALLCPYLKNSWNRETLAVALDQPPSVIADGIKELENKGLLLSLMPSKEGTLSIHPLTLDFLAQKWAQSKEFKHEVTGRLAREVASNPDWLDLPITEMVGLLRPKADEYERAGNLEKARNLIKIALQKASTSTETVSLRFIDGRLSYKDSDWQLGIEIMKSAYAEQDGKGLSNDDVMFLSSAILHHGERRDEEWALDLVASRIGNVTTVPSGLIEEFIRIALSRNRVETIGRFINNIKESEFAYCAVSEMWEQLDDARLVHTLDKPLVKVLRNAASYKWAADDEKAKMSAKREEIEKKIKLSAS